jgi:hypothetical protein
MVRGEAGIDLTELLLLPIIESNLLVAAIQREVLGKLVGGACFTKLCLLVIFPDSGRKPGTPFLVNRRTARLRSRQSNVLAAPVWRWQVH